MIDIHAHILPGIDDGAADMNNALEMASLAVESGVTVMVATPHSSVYGEPQNFWDQNLARKVRDFRDALEKENIPLISVTLLVSNPLRSKLFVLH